MDHGCKTRPGGDVRFVYKCRYYRQQQEEKKRTAVSCTAVENSAECLPLKQCRLRLWRVIRLRGWIYIVELAGLVESQHISDLSELRIAMHPDLIHLMGCPRTSILFGHGLGSRMWIPVCVPVYSGPHFPEFRYSAKFPGSGGTHVGIKSFQGKINLLRNSGSGIPDPEFRREGPVTSATIPYRTTILLQFAHTIQCCLWCLVRHHHHLHQQPPYAAHDIPSQ